MRLSSDIIFVSLELQKPSSVGDLMRYPCSGRIMIPAPDDKAASVERTIHHGTDRELREPKLAKTRLPSMKLPLPQIPTLPNYYKSNTALTPDPVKILAKLFCDFPSESGIFSIRTPPVKWVGSLGIRGVSKLLFSDVSSYSCSTALETFQRP